MAETNYAVFRSKQNELSEVFNVGRYIDKIAETAASAARIRPST